MEISADGRERVYRTRQARLTILMSAIVTVAAVTRMASAWNVSWVWVTLAGAVAVAQFALLAPRAKNLIHSPRLGRLTRVGWFVALALVTGFAMRDDAGLAIYPLAAALLVASISSTTTLPAIVGLGGLTIVGYLLQLVTHPHPAAGLNALIVGLIAAVVWRAAMTTGSRRRMLASRRSTELRTEALLENASDAIIAIAPHGEIVYASSSVRTVLGYEPSWLTNDRLTAMTHPENLATISKWVTGIFSSPLGHSTRIEARTRRADGTWIDVEVIGVNRLHDHTLGAAVLSIRDISERKALEGELTRQAFEDSLTGIPNRALFQDRLEHALARNRRDDGRITLMLIDLDNFKAVNDSLGHGAGDLLIKSVAVRIRQQVRPSDTLARLGGDEFAILIEDVDELEAADMADRVLNAIRKPVRLGNRDLFCTASLGIATVKASDGEPEPGALLRDADLAMYAAKASGHDRYVQFDPAMYTDILREADERADLERALADGEFVVHYQPIVDLPTGKLTGVEALVRWQHPHRGLLSPTTFIPLAEVTGLIVPLGRWVLEQACAQMATWCEEFSAAKELRMSVNLSPRQFQHRGLVHDVAQILTVTGVNPKQIVLEITESLLMQDIDATVKVLGELKTLGIRLAIDDFGTGYSSLSYLNRFPVDILKIDRSFVEGIIAHGENAALADAVVQLGQALQLQTVAEGIETPEQWSTLRDLGCDLGQGFLFAKPAEPGQIAAILAQGPVSL